MSRATEELLKTRRKYLIMWHTYAITLQRAKNGNNELWYSFFDNNICDQDLVHDARKVYPSLIGEISRSMVTISSHGARTYPITEEEKSFVKSVLDPFNLCSSYERHKVEELIPLLEDHQQKIAESIAIIDNWIDEKPDSYLFLS
jgi:hypothetical protein